MNKYDWLLFLHLIGAFAIVAALVAFTVLIVWGRRATRSRDLELMAVLARPATVLIAGGMALTLIFGVWLVFDAPFDYGFGDGWVLAALALFIVAAALGGMAGKRYGRAEAVQSDGEEISSEARAILNDNTSLALHAASSVAVLAVLVLMIFKPGAG